MSLQIVPRHCRERYVDLLPVAVAVFVLTAVLVADGSNLAPIVLILFGPVALAYEIIMSGIFAVQVLGRLATRR